MTNKLALSKLLKKANTIVLYIKCENCDFGNGPTEFIESRASKKRDNKWTVTHIDHLKSGYKTDISSSVMKFSEVVNMIVCNFRNGNTKITKVFLDNNEIDPNIIRHLLE